MSFFFSFFFRFLLLLTLFFFAAGCFCREKRHDTPLLKRVSFFLLAMRFTLQAFYATRLVRSGYVQCVYATRFSDTRFSWYTFFTLRGYAALIVYAVRLRNAYAAIARVAGLYAYAAIARAAGLYVHGSCWSGHRASFTLGRFVELSSISLGLQPLFQPQ